jgi:hypothetical protein
MTFPKFIWMPAVLEETLFTAAHRNVLVYCALQYINGDGSTFCVRQATVAEKLHMSRKTVNEAMVEAQRLYYLKLTGERRRGRGWHKGNEYELMLPTGHSRLEMCNPSVTQSEEGDVTDDAGMCNPPGQEYVTHGSEMCNPANAPTSTNADLYKGLKAGLSKQVLEAGTRAQAPVPHDGENTSRDLVPGQPIYDGVRVDNADYQIELHRNEASKRSEGEPESIDVILARLQARAVRLARERNEQR